MSGNVALGTLLGLLMGCCVVAPLHGAPVAACVPVFVLLLIAFLYVNHRARRDTP